MSLRAAPRTTGGQVALTARLTTGGPDRDRTGDLLNAIRITSARRRAVLPDLARLSGPLAPPGLASRSVPRTMTSCRGARSRACAARAVPGLSRGGAERFGRARVLIRITAERTQGSLRRKV